MDAELGSTSHAEWIPLKRVHSPLIAMPEADFLLAVEASLGTTTTIDGATDRVNKILRGRGAAWRFTREGRFAWVGDISRDDTASRGSLVSRGTSFLGGVRSEFEASRSELRTHAPVSRKQAVYEAGCSVESAMKVVPDKCKIAYSPTDAAQALFNHLERAGVVPRYMGREVLAAATPRNRRADTARRGGARRRY